MNRRNLAKKGFLGLCAFLFGKLPQNEESLQLAFPGTDTNSAVFTYWVWNGRWHRSGPKLWHGFDLSGPEWDDGTEIEHGM